MYVYELLEAITTAGHVLSLISLIIAVLLFIVMRRLHCMRVTIHINLMATFLLRAVIWYLHIPSFMGEDFDIDYLTKLFVGNHSVDNLAEIEQIYSDQCEPHNYSWCRIHNLVMNYAVIANNFWVLIEGVYLWVLLQSFSMPTRKSLIIFILFGWVCPWIPVGIYGMYMGNDDDKCWEIKECGGLWWLIKGPQFASLATNFVIFVMVLKIVASKLRGHRHYSHAQANANNYKWRLTKSTLSLIPLLGISYLLTIFIECSNYGDTHVIVVKYFENVFSSVQGFLVAVIYCFLNSEIQEEVTKERSRWKLKNEIGKVRSDPGRASKYYQETTNVTNMTSFSDNRPDAGSI